MDFTIDNDIEGLRDLCRQILADESTADRLTELDRSGSWVDQRTWGLLAQAGVLGAVLPESAGGAGLGALAVHQVLEQVGFRTAQIPVWETVVLGGLTLARHGSPEQQADLLPGVVDGTRLLTAALVEPDGADRHRPRCTATSADGWSLNGIKTQVPLAAAADRVLVPATTDTGGVGVFLVDPGAAGVLIEEQTSVSGRPLSRMTLHEVAGELVGELGVVLDDLLLHAEAGLAALQAGNCAAALKLAADYTTGREQFGQPLAAFQAVRQRLADAWIDVEGMRLTSLQASWALESDRPRAEVERAVGIAKFWAADGGHRVTSTAQHVHGGIGIDLDYGLHRHFRLGKYIEMTLGAAGDQARRLGVRYAEPS